MLQGCVLVYIRPPNSFLGSANKFKMRAKNLSLSSFSSLGKNRIPPNETKLEVILALNNTSIQDDSSRGLLSMEETASFTTTNPPTSSVSHTSTLRPISTELTLPSGSYTLQPHGIASYKTWEKGSFCESFIGKTLSKPVTVCDNKDGKDMSLTCFGSSISKNMAICTARYLAVEPRKLQKSVQNCDACNIQGSGAFRLLKTSHTHCNKPSLDSLKSSAETNDPMYRSMVEITSNPEISTDGCKEWVNKTAYFFHSQRYHIYFRLYSYYNLYKTLLETDARPGEFVIVRMAESNGYKFGDFERSLFPELRTLSEFEDQKTCFREVVFSPWCYAAVMFRCKMEMHTKSKCLECDGEGLLGTSLMTFRTRALQACSLVDQTAEERHNRERKSIVFVKRKPYHRWDGDVPHNFQRVLTNQDELLKEIKSRFHDVDLHDVYMEDLTLCEQMRLVHECDVFIGVHGAGLVHSWWLQHNAALLELVPSSHAGIPSFKTLTRLSGRRYHSLAISGDKFHVTVDISTTLKEIQKILGAI